MSSHTIPAPVVTEPARKPSVLRRTGLVVAGFLACALPTVWTVNLSRMLLVGELDEHRFHQLTGREPEVLDLVARGLENRRIARELHLSDKTVRNHVSNLMTKLGVEDRSEAIARARAAGLGAAEH